MVILHADADAFFASVEQRDDPALRGRPMVVAHEVVACPSYEARALGIHAGMPLRQVRRRWPQVLVTGYRAEAYEEASVRLFEVFRRFTPLVEPGSVEEAFLDVTGRDRGDPRGLAVALRAAARAEVGLPVSVGVGRTKLMAKLASRRAKPDGLVVVDAELEARVRPRLRLDELWGVGPTTYGSSTPQGCSSSPTSTASTRTTSSASSRPRWPAGSSRSREAPTTRRSACPGRAGRSARAGHCPRRGPGPRSWRCSTAASSVPSRGWSRSTGRRVSPVGSRSSCATTTAPRCSSAARSTPRRSTRRPAVRGGRPARADGLRVGRARRDDGRRDAATSRARLTSRWLEVAG